MGSDKRQKFEPGYGADYHSNSKNTIGIVEKAQEVSNTNCRSFVFARKVMFPCYGRSLSKEQCNAIRLPVGFEGSMYALGKHVELFAHCDSSSTFWYWMYNGTEKMSPFLATMSKSLCSFSGTFFHWETVTL